ncbi:SPOR domain-containing protein [Orbus sturtevantii]|uniref:SPOR domain-containing protein n=1 Tax=Orbus sturtevantii TaxID=3074109 RepID=UPI00370D8B23
MNKKYYQLVGFITLILLALLLAPYVLTNKSKEIESTIPILSSPDELELGDNIHELDIYEPTASSPITSQQIETNPQSVLIEESADPSIINNFENDYVIQLAALKNKQKIEELVALLRLNNYDVYTIPKVAQEGQLTRLFVGYYPTKAQAETVIIDLENLTKLKGFIATN